MTKKITEQWLSQSGFKYYQEERQPQKHWQLWLGWGNEQKNSCIHDIGIELSMAWWLNRNNEKVGDIDGWNCWIISNSGSRKLIHIRTVYKVGEVINLIESITGFKFNPNNHMYGNCYCPEIVKRLQSENSANLRNP